jgi:predicted  nucleic acid-binding Zn-ribbon protein
MVPFGWAVVTVLAIGGIVPSNAVSLHGTPVQKVLEMLAEMIAKGQKEAAIEKMIFEDYEEWVDDQTILTNQEIKTAKTLIDKLTAEIDKAESDISNLNADIADLDGEIASWEKDQKAATDLRRSENAEFMKVQADYSDSIDAIARAIVILQQQNMDYKQAAALLEETSAAVPRARQVLSALMQEKSGQEKMAQEGAPAVAAYEFQSGGIIEMLEKLKKKFKQELSDVETAESNSAHAYDLEMLHLGNNIETAKGNRDEKAEHRASLATQSAELKGQLADTKDGLAVDEKYLADMKATFKAKSAAFADNQRVRAEEVEAIQKAVEILSSPAVQGHADKYLPKLIQKSISLLQLGSASERNHAKDRVASFLKDRAMALSSKVLSTFAMQVSENPFAKVIDMIKSLIATLEEEAQAEAGHKAFCDQELAKNKNKRENKASEVAQKTAVVDRYTTEIQTLGSDIATLAKEQKELTKAMQEATEERTQEKKENLQTIKDAKEAQEALSSALSVLKEFYAKQGGFIQRKKQPAVVPEMKAYKGMQGSTGGVVGMIEVIQSDFARLEAETTANENTAEREYNDFMADAKADVKSKHKEEFDKSLLKDQKEYELGLAQKDLGESQAALNAALEYYAKLKPQCIEVHVSYEERVARRKQEIEALQEAYRILSEMGPGA